MFLLTGHCATYAWGKARKDSLVAELASQRNWGNGEDPYAELWLGTHPNGPATISGTVDTLAQQHGELPFLFKVLSIARALSIQAHPDLSLAQRLHQSSPGTYKDPNHKPEMALALSDDFEALCSFRPINEIADALRQYPELVSVVGEYAAGRVIACASERVSQQQQKCEAIRTAFTQLMHCPSETVRAVVARLVARIKAQSGEDDEDEAGDDEVTELLVRLNSQFPGDVGVLCALFLNHKRFRKGECMFIGAGEPHAYLSGDCAELMSCSDNVVRAGLTPKEIDKETLLGMLTYKSGHVDLIQPKVVATAQFVVKEFVPPLPDFVLCEMIVQPHSVASMPQTERPRLIQVLDGHGYVELCGDEVCDRQDIHKGTALFIPKDNNTLVHNTSNTELLHVIIGAGL